jgi:hypothetical protein
MLQDYCIILQHLGAPVQKMKIAGTAADVFPLTPARKAGKTYF